MIAGSNVLYKFLFVFLYRSVIKPIQKGNKPSGPFVINAKPVKNPDKVFNLLFWSDLRIVYAHKSMRNINRLSPSADLKVCVEKISEGFGV
jgi:hypothetical protein